MSKKSSSGRKKTLLGDNVNRFFIVLTLTANLVAWLLVLVKLFSLPEPIILHYNSYFGVDWDGANCWALLMPASGLLAFGLNLGLGFYFIKKDFLITRLFTGAAFLFNLMINAAVVALIFVNQV